MFEERIDNIIGIAYAMDLLEYVGKVSFCLYFHLFLLIQCHSLLFMTWFSFQPFLIFIFGRGFYK